MRCPVPITAVLACVLLAGGSASACSCGWEGAFLQVARGSLLVVRGTVIRHHLESAPCMDFLVTEVLQSWPRSGL